MLAKAQAERPTAQEVARRLTRLESSFAEAGTYVGTKNSSTALEEVKAPAPKKATSVLTRAHAPGTHPTTDRTADASTKPHLPPLSAPARTAPTTSVVERDAVRTGPSRGVIIALVAVVLGLLGALVFLPTSKDEAPAPTPVPPGPVVAVVDAGPAPEVVDAGQAMAAAPVDAGSDEPEDLAMLPTSMKPKPKAQPRVQCKFDPQFAADARAQFSSLSKRVPPAQRDLLEDRSDELAEALQAKDCKKTQAVLNKLNGLVRAPPK
jgi:hypothetical protein